jgi:DNA-binding XRE family transcriptional regulator
MSDKRVARAQRRRADDTFDPAKAASDFGRLLCLVARVEEVSAGEVARRLGVHRTTVVRLVQRDTKPKAEMAIRTARVLRIPVNLAEALATGRYRRNRFWGRMEERARQTGFALDLSQPATLGGAPATAMEQFALHAVHMMYMEETHSSRCDVCGVSPFSGSAEMVQLLTAGLQLAPAFKSLAAASTLLVLIDRIGKRHAQLRLAGEKRPPTNTSRNAAQVLSALMSAAHR